MEFITILPLGIALLPLLLPLILMAGALILGHYADIARTEKKARELLIKELALWRKLYAQKNSIQGACAAAEEARMAITLSMDRTSELSKRTAEALDLKIGRARAELKSLENSFTVIETNIRQQNDIIKSANNMTFLQRLSSFRWSLRGIISKLFGLLGAILAAKDALDIIENELQRLEDEDFPDTEFCDEDSGRFVLGLGDQVEDILTLINE